jgi:hypothetical protein
MLSKKERKENAKALAMLRKKELERKQLAQRFNLSGNAKTSWTRFSDNALIKKGHFDYHLNK